jgi:hypothetical protein
MKTAYSLVFLVVSSLLGLAAEYRCCLPWEVVVVNEQGQPLPSCTVVQEWGYNFGQNATNFTDSVTTDTAGRVRLPQRGVAYPKSTAEKLADRLTVRPGLGAWANVFVWKTGYDGQFVYIKHDSRVVYTTNGLFSRIVLRPTQPPK